MDDIICRSCGRHFAPTADRVVSAHHTSEGVVRYLRCPAGHLSITVGARPLAA
jgi:hypothetical protein